MIGVFLDQLGQRLIVNLAYLGADLVKLRIACQLWARCCAAVIVSECLTGVVTFDG